MSDQDEKGRLVKRAFFGAAITFVILLSSQPVLGSLRVIEVRKGDAVSKSLGLTILVTSDEHFPASPIVTVTARADSPLRTMFGAGLRVGEGQHLRATSLLLDVPVEFTRPYQTSDLRLVFRLEKSMLRSATLYLRTGTPLSEVVYAIRLAEHMVMGSKK
jgi:hypothetical protein